MGQTIEIKTDILVHEFVWIFNNKIGIEIVREIDSANYGTGFDLNVKTIECRVFDDSSTACFENETEDRCLQIEIDRLNSYQLEEQINVSNYLKEIITQAGFINRLA